MTTAHLLTRLLLPALGAGALALPSGSLASEPTPAPAAEGQAQTTVAAPAPEAPTPTATVPASAAPSPVEGAPEVKRHFSQGVTPALHARGRNRGTGQPTPGTGSTTEGAGSGPRSKQLALPPSALTPALPLALNSSLGGVPGFFIESFQVPPFLLPIFQAAGTAYDVPWQVLAAINEVETDYGRDLSVSSAGAEGWMQFLPAEWAQYGVDANGSGLKDPYNPADAIFAAARYLHAAGGSSDVRAAVFSYNHSQAYVESVMLRAQLLGGTPPELLGAITGLTEARFPVHAAAHYSDGFPPASPSGAAGPGGTIVATTIYSQAGAPVIAVQDGEVVQIGTSPELGNFIVLRDAYGNTYTYGRLGSVASLYPVLEPHVNSAVSGRVGGGHASEPVPHGPATAGAQPRSPLSEGGVVSGFALGAAATLEPAPPAAAAAPAPSSPVPASVPSRVRVFRAGPDDVYLHTLRSGVQVIAGTVLGHIGASGEGVGAEAAPHIVFQIRPAGPGAPLIDPKPILDGWVALENTSIFAAKGENPFLATSPTVGQVLLESKQQLEPQVLRDGGIRLGRCGRADVQSGRVDRRVLSLLEYLSVSGLKPTVRGLPCPESTPAQLAAYAPAGASSVSVEITAINGVPVAGNQGPGTPVDTAIRRLLMLQGPSRPAHIESLYGEGRSTVAIASPSAADAIHVSFSPTAGAHRAGLSGSELTPQEWIELIARLGEIPDPTVPSAPSAAAISDGSSGETAAERGSGGDN
jgi:murein DD-endopeptidase MepM/ murein hydrolase activator NlpD